MRTQHIIIYFTQVLDGPFPSRQDKLLETYRSTTLNSVLVSMKQPNDKQKVKEHRSASHKHFKEQHE